MKVLDKDLNIGHTTVDAFDVVDGVACAGKAVVGLVHLKLNLQTDHALRYRMCQLSQLFHLAKHSKVYQ